MQPRKCLKLSTRFSETAGLHFSPTIPTFATFPGDNFSSCIPGAAALSLGMEDSVRLVEAIIGYSFGRKTLLEEALTHSSFSESLNYERLEFIGDAVLGLATSNHLFRVYPDLDPGKLSLLRAANVSTERLARVALRKGLIRYMRHSAPSLLDKVIEFAEIVSQEGGFVTYGGSVKAPKVLADIVESIAAAVYVDVHYDIHTFWAIFRGVMEPLVTPDDLKQQPQPVTLLFELCRKQGKEILIKHQKNGKKILASVYVNGKSVVTAVADQKNIARLNAAKAALPLLANSDPAIAGLNLCSDINGPFEIKGAKHYLHEICEKIKWYKPAYRIENDSGPPHNKKFTCSVRIATEEGILCMMGEEKSRMKEAENSAASLMIRALEIADLKFS
ncbi:ribonuclease 3-like protein 2 [Neltuma alba]|uniref:ribonuclease 3-like protein 2 n=1 Tax=Neltuma alba TaxID=207710 RepID=UPI0010A3502E|nr:ribonuclease 3-like protein 2 [Prosopis alba]